MTDERIDAITRRIAEIDARLAAGLGTDEYWALFYERRELNSERSALETARFLHLWAELRAA